jgi:catechol 1,2-dioxygenase
MFIESDKEVTPAVLAAMENTTDPRFKEIITALVRHLHAFAREVKLTEPEWERGIGYLVELGQRTNDTHNEAILASDAIGLSTLVCLMNNGQEGNTETAAALLGPFWRMKSPVTQSGGSIVRSQTPGPALFADIQVKDAKGNPISDVEVDVWQASPVGKYENQDDTQADMNLRGKFRTDAEGKFSFRSVKPAGYPVPTNGPVGELLRAQKRHPFRPAHVHFLLFKQGFKTLVTQVFVDEDKHLESDAVFGVTKKLVGDFKKRTDKAPASDVRGEWYSLNYTFHMEAGEAHLPTPPIK